MEQQRGADPGKVIDRMAYQIGQMSKDSAAALSIIDDLEAENAVLRSENAALKAQQPSQSE